MNNTNESLHEFIKYIEPRYRTKISRIAGEYAIARPIEFRKLSKANFMKMHGCGKSAFIELRLAMLKYGVPYADGDSMEKIESERGSLRHGVVKMNDSLRLRFKVLNRDKFKCRYCGRGPANDESVILNVDHIKPLSSGGEWTEENMITSCRECNLGKSDKIEVDPAGLLEVRL